ncbi:hypothetical protein F5Y19DRAFT_479096 [Xylariaceae sp. FL1651]|nr:hypothetical protein F5Y19DRAFT_479096 [Xylariaceae sp. FL1651]
MSAATLSRGDLRDIGHASFRLPSKRAVSIDSQQRVLLEVTYETMENAGLSREALSGTKIGVSVAMFTPDFERNLYKDPIDMPTYYLTGIERAIASNCISHVFDLHGRDMCPTVTPNPTSGAYPASFQESRQAIDSESNMKSLKDSAQALMTGRGDALQQYVQMADLNAIADSYEQ